ncbi:tetratricopeptide (TPR) repeat protein [Bradyrhizobium sp. LA6.1]|jgi:tetratricopeptide (TPR) repeat protein|uniref:Tetratricopeptide repeat protein n=1 Tax=Bradyrhizobium barranii subsp. barranii TaxID=2823807 RepID=A0A7Z0TPJ7_9BRAD|nr:tetratricopeptide repeat protein [Bradyrhizobium barranii]UGX94505.1 tetratricopeptide repeat protein [Bradyrhizobium barranii subsp. barranii]
MITAMIRLVTLGTFAAVLLSSPAFAAGGGGGGGGGGGISSTDPYAGAYADQRLQPQPVYPKRWGTKATHKGRKPNNQSSIGDPAFAAGYRVAYDTIYERNDYATAIAELKSLGHDDHPNVANLIGYSYRKLGDYEQSQVWYERALKADPNHVLTWQYYGLWQLERGNREQALYHLSRIAAICGTDCEEYRSLAAALDKPTGTALAY